MGNNRLFYTIFFQILLNSSVDQSDKKMFF